MSLSLRPWLLPRTSLVPLRRPRRRPPRFGRLSLEELERRLAPSVNIPITTDPRVQQNPSIAADPHDARHLVVAYMDYSLLTTGYAGIGVAVSEDAGADWQYTSVPLPAPFNRGAADPEVHFDNQGHVYVSFMAATFLGPLPPITDPGGGAPRALGFQANNGIFVSRSDDGGLDWNTPVAVVSHLYDGQNKVFFEIKPDLAIDTFAKLPNGQPNPNYGSLYVSWSRYYPAGQFPGETDSTGGSEIMFAVSRDGGQTWKIQLQPEPGTGIPGTVIFVDFGESGENSEGLGHRNWSHVTIGPEGDIYVSLFLTSWFGVFHSRDGGQTFTPPNALNVGYPFGFNNNILPGSTLNNSNFRTQDVRAIAADPTRPGYVYTVEALQVTDPSGNTLDEGDIIFARSTDYGVTWQTTFQVGPHLHASVLNDDNFGQSSTGTPNDVADGQALPRLVTDAQGDIAIIWYDTRRDPADEKLDVFSTVSSDGGQTFSPNFRVTDQSFDPNAGQFTAANGSTSYYLGDFLGLAPAYGIGYAAWTDTRNGNQDIYFSSFSINSPPAPPSNRFAPNNNATLATDLGQVVVRSVPKLSIAVGDEEWFRVQAAATGPLTVTATLAAPGDSLRLQLFDGRGITLLSTGSTVRNASGQVTGQSLSLPGQSGQTYLVRVLPGPTAVGTPAVYTLGIRSLTEDLGAQVYGVESGSLAAGVQAYYALTAPAPGSLEVNLIQGTNAQGNFHLEILDPTTLSVLVSGQTTGTGQFASLALTQGQAVYLHVFGDAEAKGDFSLQILNLDQYTTPDNKTLLFPTGEGPSEAVLADLTGNGRLDIVVSHVGLNTVSLLMNNGDGTFQAPRDYPVGPFVQGSPSTYHGLPNFHRDMVVADFTGNGILDIATVNTDASTISLLFGRGDGTFEPQRIINAGVDRPFALAAGDLTNNGIEDLVVLSSIGQAAQQGAVLLGRGDGTFLPAIPFNPGPVAQPFSTNEIRLADLNHDGNLDLMVQDEAGTSMLLGNGNGTFQPAALIDPGMFGPGLAVADLPGDGNLDLVSVGFDQNTIGFVLGNGDGTFQQHQIGSVGQIPVAVAVADFGSQVTLSDGSTALGPTDGIPDLIVADSGLHAPVINGPPDVEVLPGLVDAQGHFAGFGVPLQVAFPLQPLDVEVGDLTGDGTKDIVVVNGNGILVIYGKKPVIPANDTPQTARNLGTVVHVVEPIQTIVPGHEDSYYTLTVPTEAARGAGNEILDFSALFVGIEERGNPGLSMSVEDVGGRLLGSGERFQVLVSPGSILTLHVFGVSGPDGTRGTGAYTLDIATLPQVVSVEAQPLLPGKGFFPGGPTSSLVITLQGDRLDPDAAQNPANYRLRWLGPDGLPATPDDQGIPLEAVVYDPSTNVDVAAGAVYPVAIRQTVTLLFADPLPAGSYLIDLSSNIQAAPFNDQEQSQLSASSDFLGHPVASLQGGQILPGSQRTLANLVLASVGLGNLTVWKTGTPFLTQLHDDLGALLDAALTLSGDSKAIPGQIDNQIVARFDPALGPPNQRLLAVLVIWLDPVSFAAVDPSGNRAFFNLQERSFANSFSQAFISVAGNVEVLVLPFVATSGRSLFLTVADVPPSARGGAVYFGPNAPEVTPLTAALRSGETSFRFFAGLQPEPPPPPARTSLVAAAAAPADPPSPAASSIASPSLLVSIINRVQTASAAPVVPQLAFARDGVQFNPGVPVAALAPRPGEPGKEGGTGVSPPGPANVWLQMLDRLFPGLGKWLEGLLQFLMGMVGQGNN